MTLLTRAFNLFGRLYERYAIEPGIVSDEPPSISTMIVPITNADELLQEPIIRNQVAVDLSGTLGNYVAIETVPAGKRWRLYGAFVDLVATNSQLQIRSSRDGTTRTHSLLVLGTAAAVWEGFRILNETDSIGRSATGNAADDSRSSNIFALEEDAF